MSRQIFRRETFQQTKSLSMRLGGKETATRKCDECGQSQTMFSPEIIAEQFSPSTREIYRMIEAGEVHYLETDEKQVFVCMNSILGVAKLIADSGATQKVR